MYDDFKIMNNAEIETIKKEYDKRLNVIKIDVLNNNNDNITSQNTINNQHINQINQPKVDDKIKK